MKDESMIEIELNSFEKNDDSLPNQIKKENNFLDIRKFLTGKKKLNLIERNTRSLFLFNLYTVMRVIIGKFDWLEIKTIFIFLQSNKKGVSRFLVWYSSLPFQKRLWMHIWEWSFLFWPQGHVLDLQSLQLYLGG